ncbi:hypothetical protein, partial, partial [Parasitella parasitica]
TDMYSPPTSSFHWESSSNNIGRLSSPPTHATPSSPEESSSRTGATLERIDQHHADRYRESQLVDTASQPMQWSVISTRNTDTGNLHRCIIRSRMGNHLQQSGNEGNVEHTRAPTTYQLQRTFSDMEVSTATFRTGPNSSHLLRQCLGDSICTEFRRLTVTSPSGISRAYLEILPN